MDSPDPPLDARVARTRATVLRTATDLLVEGGPSAVTIEAIVAASGVAKSTIYRHWDSRDEVVLDVVQSCAPHIEAPDASLGFEESLRRLLHELRDVLTDPDWARVFPALLSMRYQQHGIAQLEQRLERRQDDALERVLARGVQEGRLPADIDVERAGAVLIGPMVFSALVGKPALDAEFCDHLVDGFLRATSL